MVARDVGTGLRRRTVAARGSTTVGVVPTWAGPGREQGDDHGGRAGMAASQLRTGSSLRAATMVIPRGSHGSARGLQRRWEATAAHLRRTQSCYGGRPSGCEGGCERTGWEHSCRLQKLRGARI